MYIKIFCALLTVAVCVAIVLIFNLRLSTILYAFNNLFSSFSMSNDEQAKQSSKKRPLAKIISYYKDKPESFIEKEILNAKSILAETRQENRYGKVIAECVVFAAIGVAIALLLKNIFLVPCLGLGLFFVPLWKLKLYRIKYDKYQAMQLESALSLITTSYVRNNDIISAVEENIPNISGFLRVNFEEFLAEYKVNANLKSCIRSLQGKIDNAVFREWCDCLIRTYENSEMKENLLTIANKLSTIRIVQSDLDAEMKQSITEFIIMMCILAIVYPMVYVVNKDWFALYSTTIGQFCVACTVGVALYSVHKLFNVMTPVKYER